MRTDPQFQRWIMPTARKVRNRAFALLLAVSAVAWVVEYALGWDAIDPVLTTVFVSVVTVLVVVTVSGLGVWLWYHPKIPVGLTYSTLEQHEVADE